MFTVIPQIVAKPKDLKLWKRLFLIPIIMASEMRDKKKDRAWKLKKLKEEDWTEFTLSAFKGKYKENRGSDREKSEEEFKEKVIKKFQNELNKGNLGKAVSVVSNQQRQVRSGEEKYDNLVSKYIVDESINPVMEVTSTMTREAKKIEFNIASCRRVLQNMKDGKASSIDFLRTEIIKIMVEIHSEQNNMTSEAGKFMSFLVWFTNQVFQNTLPEEVMMVVNATMGESIEQKENKLRSIGMTTWYQKFTSNCVSDKTNRKVAEKIKLNYALQKDASAKLNHVIQIGRQMESDKLTTKTDAQNAFPTTKREATFKAITEIAPELGPHTKGLLTATNVYSAGKEEGVDHITQTDGLNIGGQRCSLMFVIAVNEALEQKQIILNTEGGGIIRSNVDDEIFNSTLEGLEAIRQFNETEGPEQNGVKQNIHKWTVLLPPQFTIDQREELRQRWTTQKVFLHPDSLDAQRMKAEDYGQYIQICKEYGMVTTGIPCGSKEYIHEFINNFLKELREEVDRYKVINKGHAKWAVLKQSISTRIVHLQRGMTPDDIMRTNLVDRYQNLLKDMLADITMVHSDSIQEYSMNIARLRSIDGGGGLKFHHDNTLPAYVASFTTALREIVKAYPIVQEMIEEEIEGREWDESIDSRPDNLLQYFRSINILAEKGSCIDGKSEIVSLKGLWKLTESEGLLKGLQGKLCKYTYKDRLSKVRKELSLLQPYNFCHVKVLTSGAGSESAAFINMVPREGQQIKDSQELAHAMRRRFQMVEPNYDPNLVCKCGKKVDPFLWHIQKCEKFAKGRIETHEQLKNIISHMLSTARIPHTVEGIPFKERGQHANSKRRLDIVVNTPRLLIPDTSREKILLDQTVTNATVKTADWIGKEGENHMESAIKEGKTANEAEQSKHRKYDADARDYNMVVCPMGFEVQGKWGDETHKLFKLITSRMNQVNNTSLLPHSVSTLYWRNKICLTLQSYVSKHILNAMYSLPFRPAVQNVIDPQDYMFSDLYSQRNM